MRSNIYVPRPPVYTAEGAKGVQLSPIKELRRAVLSTMLFEDGFYEDGKTIAQTIEDLVKQVKFEEAASLAVEARNKYRLRHVPLHIVACLFRSRLWSGRKLGDLTFNVVQRPDEMGELISLYRSTGQKKLPNQLKLGLARRFKRFNEYALGKYNSSNSAWKLRDVMFMVHPKPYDETQEGLFKRVADKELKTPDTWETSLSAGADKKETFTRLLKDENLGALALLRNLRNMIESGVDEGLIREGLGKMKTDRVLPFRFITAARYAPRLEDALEQAMFRSLGEYTKFKGPTAILVDHSGSMEANVSAKSELSRFDAANGVAMLAREVCDHARIFAFGTGCMEVPTRRGFGLGAAIRQANVGGSTYLGQAIQHVYKQFPECERLIVITDEQSADRPPAPKGKGYVVNVAPYRNGISFGPWVNISGWSEAVIDFIREYENEDNTPKA